jgi:hypothetical protein
VDTSGRRPRTIGSRVVGALLAGEQPSSPRSDAAHAPCPAQAFVDVAPRLAAEWHPTLNGRPATDYRAGSSHLAWWLCSQGHEWQALIVGRVKGSGCLRCGFAHTSRQEIELFAYLSTWLPHAFGIGSRVHQATLPKLPLAFRNVDMLFDRIVVEFDGSFWHQNGAGRDLAKTIALEDAGYFVLRIRELPLEPLRPHDLTVETRAPAPDVAGAAVERMVELGWLPLGGREVLREADLEALNLRASGLAEEMLNKRSVRDLGAKSLEATHPGLAAEWHKRNLPILPSGVSAGSSRTVWWRCRACAHEWRTTVAARTRAGTGRPECGRALIAAARRRPKPGQSLADLYPHLLAELMCPGTATWMRNRCAPQAE